MSKRNVAARVSGGAIVLELSSRAVDGQAAGGVDRARAADLKRPRVDIRGAAVAVAARQGLLAGAGLGQSAGAGAADHAGETAGQIVGAVADRQGSI